MKRENRATIVVYFDDESRLQWDIRKGSPAALDRFVLSDELIRFARSIGRKPPDGEPSGEVTIGRRVKKAAKRARRRS